MSSFLKTTILFLALGVAGAAFAQQPDQPPPPQSTPQGAPQGARQPNPTREARRLSKQLGLTADQGSQVQAIFADREQKMQSLMSSNPDPKSMRQQRRAIMQDSEQKIDAVLTPAQQQQWAAMKANRRQGPGGAAGAPPPSAPPAGPSSY